MTDFLYFPAPTTRSPEQLPYLLNQQALAQLLGYAPRTLRRYKAVGRILAPAGLGLWRRDEVMLWIEFGMPVDEVWQKTKPKRFRKIHEGHE